jgi:hypothetical protein
MLTFKRTTTDDGFAGFRVLAGAAELGTISHRPDLFGMAWRGIAPDGTTFAATSKPKIAQRLQIHAAARREAVR